MIQGGPKRDTAKARNRVGNRREATALFRTRSKMLRSRVVTSPKVPHPDVTIFVTTLFKRLQNLPSADFGRTTGTLIGVPAGFS